MLKLIYDQKVGFKDLFIIEKNCEYDLTQHLIALNEVNLDMIKDGEFSSEEDYPAFMSEQDFYNLYIEDLDQMFDDYKDWFEILEEMSIEEAAHTYFKDICFAKGKKAFLPGVFEIKHPYLALIEEDSYVEYVGRSTRTMSKLEKEFNEIADKEVHTINCANKSKAQIQKEIKAVKRVAESRAKFDSDVMSSKEVCAYLNISRQSLSNYVKAGKIKASEADPKKYSKESVIAFKKNN